MSGRPSPTEPIPIEQIALEGRTITAITVGPEGYEDWFLSSFSVAVIPPMPFVPELAFSVPKPAVTYAEVGGAMIAGNAPGPGLVGPATVSLTNAAEIPVRYLNSGEFVIQWTYDGSDPRSGVPNEGASFSGGFPGQDVPIALEHWGSSASALEMNVVAKSVAGPESIAGPALLDSEIVSGTVGIDPMQLREPVISLASGTYSISEPIGLELVTHYGDTPEGARIFYTLDGSDPTLRTASSSASLAPSRPRSLTTPRRRA